MRIHATPIEGLGVTTKNDTKRVVLGAEPKRTENAAPRAVVACK